MTTLDLTQLPPPRLVEEIDLESLIALLKTDLVRLAPADIRASLEATLALESEPVTMLVELAAYREMLIRQRINEAASSTLLAYAAGADLDHRAADYGLNRQLIRPADPEANPPLEAEWETDDRLRQRCLLAIAGSSAAGPVDAYRSATMNASPFVASVDVDTPVPGQVRVWLLDTRNDGVADAALCDTVAAALNAETVRPLCDRVSVLPSQPRPFEIVARIVYQTGGELASGGLDGARQRLDAMLKKRRTIRGSVPLSAIDAALHVEGVDRVEILSPAASVVCGVGEFPHCTRVEFAP
ncbi:hypothetical protein BUE93_04915 [Chromobacterium amazonense]|uniref:Uncharacterized protein n=1 Tax=Chromobacterium amazonense TaxID=1382803 RepID=A0A2S9X7P7_9NEIS|nr:baseplate J/gp47 family protein [Chromobacterium amazonense]PRP71750.1 hypothetical protein BUE93_04915 [Chromobacterium amazonense]